MKLEKYEKNKYQYHLHAIVLLCLFITFSMIQTRQNTQKRRQRKQRNSSNTHDVERVKPVLSPSSLAFFSPPSLKSKRKKERKLRTDEKLGTKLAAFLSPPEHQRSTKDIKNKRKPLQQLDPNVGRGLASHHPSPSLFPSSSHPFSSHPSSLHHLGKEQKDYVGDKYQQEHLQHSSINEDQHVTRRSNHQEHASTSPLHPSSLFHLKSKQVTCLNNAHHYQQKHQHQHPHNHQHSHKHQHQHQHQYPQHPIYNPMFNPMSSSTNAFYQTHQLRPQPQPHPRHHHHRHHLQPRHRHHPPQQKPIQKEVTIEDLEKLAGSREQLDKILAQEGYTKKSVHNRHVNKSDLSNLRKCRAAVKESKRLLIKKGKFTAVSKLQRQFLACASILSPKTSHDKIALIFGLSRASFVEELGCLQSCWGKKDTDEFYEALAKSSIKPSVISRSIAEIAAESLLLFRDEIITEKTAVYMGCDKGQNNHLIKCAARWSKKKKKVVTFLLDVEKSGGFSKDAAFAIAHSTARLHLDEDFVYRGSCTDAGGGGVGNSLRDALKVEHLTHDDFLVAFCGLHGINLLLQVPIETFSGQSGIEARTGLQVIHSAYDLQQAQGVRVSREIFDMAAAKVGKPILDKNGKPLAQMKFLREPILNRWWTVGEASQFLAKNMEIFTEYVTMCCEMKRNTTADQKIMTIVTRLFSMIKEGVIVSDVYFIAAYSEAFISPHVTWLQRGDSRIGNTPGFLSRLMLGECFLLDFELQTLKRDWRSNDLFQLFVSSISPPTPPAASTTNNSTTTEEDISTQYGVDPSQIVEEKGEAYFDKGVSLRDIKLRPVKDPQKQALKANRIFNCAHKKLHSIRHFSPYWNDLLFLGLFGEPETAQILAKKLLGKSDEESLAGTEETFASPFYDDKEIHLPSFLSFLNKHVNWENARICDRLKEIGKQRLELVASQKFSIWEKRPPKEFAEIAECFKINFAALASTTHHVEGAVGQATYCDNDRRTEQKVSQYAIGTNFIKEINEAALISKQEAWLQGENKAKKAEDLDVDSTDATKMGAAFKWVVHHNMHVNEVTSNPDTETIFKSIFASLYSTSEGFDIKRETVKIEQYKSKIAGRESKPIDAVKFARRIGYDETDAMGGKLAFGGLRKAAHFELVKQELAVRGVEFPSVCNYRNALILLKGHVKEQTEKETKKSIELKDVKSFLPLYSNIDDWKERGYVGN